MESSLSGKKAIVVGAYGGMGRAVSLALAAAGVDCALIGRDEASLVEVEKLCAESGAASCSIPCDLANSGEIESAVETAINQLKGLDFLIHCAGRSTPGKLHEMNMADADRHMDINLKAHYYLARFALPAINETPGGALVKIGSVNHPWSGAGLYLAANQGGEGFHEVLFEDVREFGTRICTIKPGWVNTPLVQGRGVDPKLMIQPEDVAATVIFVLSMPGTTCPREITLLPQHSPYI